MPVTRAPNGLFWIDGITVQKVLKAKKFLMDLIVIKNLIFSKVKDQLVF